jgi:hypothetical protein
MQIQLLPMTPSQCFSEIEPSKHFYVRTSVQCDGVTRTRGLALVNSLLYSTEYGLPPIRTVLLFWVLQDLLSRFYGLYCIIKNVLAEAENTES